jgi:hypothetical protein
MNSKEIDTMNQELYDAARILLYRLDGKDLSEMGSDLPLAMEHLRDTLTAFEETK